MAIPLTGDWTRPAPDQADGRNAVLTNRGEAALLLIRLERLWPVLTAADRAYVGPMLQDLARQAGEGV